MKGISIVLSILFLCTTAARASAQNLNSGLDFLDDVIDGLAAPLRGPDPHEESERRQRLKQARTSIEAMDLMTPKEAMKAFGIVDDAESANLEDMIEPTTSSENWLRIVVSINRQRLKMVGSETAPFFEKVSTGKPGYETLRGCRHPTRRKKMHYSTIYENSPMPFSIFFRGGIALHATGETSKLGTPASHGCVRQSWDGALKVYQTVDYYVERYGSKSVLICVVY